MVTKNKQQGHEEKCAPAQSIRDDKVTSPGDAHNDIPLVNSPKQCFPVIGCDRKVPLISFILSRDVRSECEKLLTDWCIADCLLCNLL